MVHGPKTSMCRPHPAVWRMIHGVLMVYMLFLTWLLFQDVNDARSFLKVGGGGCLPVSANVLQAECCQLLVVAAAQGTNGCPCRCTHGTWTKWLRTC